MLIKGQLVEVKWHIKNKNWYEKLGYVFTKFRESFYVRAEDLINGFDGRVKVQCDYCFETVDKTFKQLMKERKDSLINKDCCRECKGVKQKEGMMKVYGVDCTLKIPEVKKKSLDTLYENYGVDNPFSNEGIKRQIKKTNTDKYGFENPMKNNDIKKKAIETNLIKYGKEFYTQTEEYKERVKITNIEVYGSPNPAQNEEVKKKIKETFILNYGVDHPMKDEEVNNKKIKTNIERYGFNTPAKNKNVQDKMKKTNLEKYGVEYIFASDVIKGKIRETNLRKYGYPYVTQVPEIIEKRNRTMSANGTVSTSSQQLVIFNKLIGLGYHVEINFPVGRVVLDIALYLENCKIDIEYDAAYFHQDQKYDRRRDEFLKSNGWKVLRIKSGHLLPTDIEIIEAINRLSNSNRGYTGITLDDWYLNDSII